MSYLPFADVDTNLIPIFITGLLAGVMGRVFGTLANLVVVPTLNIFGLPLSISASTNVGQSFGRTSLSIFTGDTNLLAFRRVGVVAGIIGLPGVFAGIKLQLFLTGTPYGHTVINLCYMALLLSSAAAVFRQWIFFNRNDYYEDAPFPPFGFNWRFPLAIPGGSGTNHITLARTALVGFLLGVSTGFLGLGAGVLGTTLYMYIPGLPEKNAAATDTITMLIIGSGAFFCYAAAGRVEFAAVLILLAAITLGNRIGSFLPGELNLSHARFGFSLLMGIVAFSLTLSW